MTKLLAFAACALSLVGCMDSTHFVKSGQPGLPKNSSYYIALPEDGQYGAKPYLGSGKMTSTTIKSALQKNSQKAVSASRVEDFDQALNSASVAGYNYLVFPTILHWEDRATEWSMLPDEVEVKIDIVDVFSGEAESTTVIDGKSGIATFGGDHPQDLLPKPINEYFSLILSTPTPH